MVTLEVEKGQTIYLVWLDSSNQHGWVYDTVVPQAKVIESVGFVVAQSDEAITITSGRSDSGGVVSPLNIPICCIRSYKII
jgi:hypothetical protein